MGYLIEFIKFPFNQKLVWRNKHDVWGLCLPDYSLVVVRRRGYVIDWMA